MEETANFTENSAQDTNLGVKEAKAWIEVCLNVYCKRLS